MQQSIISVQFNNQSLFATLIDSVPYVAMKPICENIGLNWDSQRQRIQRHPILSKGTVMITAPSKGGLQEMLMLPLKMLNGWLFGVDSTRVKPEIRDAVIKYQEECFDVLANHFMPKRNGLVDLPPASKFVTPKEKLLLRTAIENQYAKTKETHAYYWRRLHNAYHVSSLEDLPTGKVDEMLAFLGLREPKLDEYVVVKQERLLELEQKAVALPPPPVQKVEPIPAPQPVFSIPDDMVMISAKRFIELENFSISNDYYFRQLPPKRTNVKEMLECLDVGMNLITDALDDLVLERKNIDRAVDKILQGLLAMRRYQPKHMQADYCG